MVTEIFHIVGYHLPVTCCHHRDLLDRLVWCGLADSNNNSATAAKRSSSSFSGPTTFQRRLYSRTLTKQEEYKQSKFKDSDKNRKDYLKTILEGNYVFIRACSNSFGQLA